jgi:hypothetical protein
LLLLAVVSKCGLLPIHQPHLQQHQQLAFDKKTLQDWDSQTYQQPKQDIKQFKIQNSKCKINQKLHN